MARAKLKAEDAKKINLFLNLCGGSIDFEAGHWYLETGNKLKILHSVPELMRYIITELETMKGNYTGEAWEAAEQEASKTRFHLKGESDRMNARREYRYGKEDTHII